MVPETGSHHSMSTVSILRRLWRHRILVAIALVLAMLAGTAVVYQLPSLQSRKYDVGIVTAHILVDTPNSQIVQVSPRGTATLGEQTLLLASLMVDGTIKSAIAQKAGLPASKLVGVNAAVTEPGASGPAAIVPPSGRNAYVITTQVMTDSAGNNLPIIALEAQAPSSAEAEKLANATLSALRSYLSSRAEVEGVADTNRMQVGELGLNEATTQAMGPSTSLGVIVFLLVFLLECGLIIGVPSLRRAWRAAGQREREAVEDVRGEKIVASSPEPLRSNGGDAVLNEAFFDFGVPFDELGVSEDATASSQHLQ
jgi:hypothetical protein